jgi:formylglycine-generating enzyme required for sulfatase activity
MLYLVAVNWLAISALLFFNFRKITMRKITIISPLWLLAGLFSAASHAASYTNSIGMKFTNIPAGSFYMGSCKLSAADKEANKKRKFMGLPAKAGACPSGASADSDARDDETPQHKVHISKAFQMGVYEVTLGQFKQFIAAGRDDLLSDDFIKDNSHGNSAAVTTVSWDDAQAFIRWLNKKEGGSRYHLPTEAEWEYAARAGTTTRFSWGNNKSQAGNYAWYRKNARDVVGARYAHPVGQKKPNPWGLYDMHGNVWEWVQDWYGKNSYRNHATNDPKGAGSGRERVIRGSSWLYDERSLRSANRSNLSPGYLNLNLGFRLVRQP